MREMKDSGIKWIGLVPKKWDIAPIRALFEEVTKKNYNGHERKALKFTYGEIVPKQNFEVDDEYVADTILNYTVVEPGTIMLNGLNLNYDFVSQRIGLVKNKGAITSAYIAFKPKDGRIISEFASYLFKAYDYCKAFHNMGGGVRKILNFNELKRYYVTYPHIGEQKKIVKFIDSATRKIDNLSADVQAEIEILETYKQSIIAEAVTKGIDKDVAVKDSNVAWMPKMPSHWKLSKYKYEVFPKNRAVEENDEILTCFRDGEVTLRRLRREEGFTISLTEHGYQGVRIGDLVIHGMDAFAGAIGCADSNGKISPVIHVCETTGNNRFFMYALRWMAYSNLLMDFSEGIRVRSSDFRNYSKLGKFNVAVPPVEEQNAIVDFLDEKIAEVEEILSDKRKQLTILTDYKKSLIYEYVTGKKEVPGL